jgi:hypothetical protein
MTPLQPRYAKKVTDEDSLMAVIIAQAMNRGNLSMSETSDIHYHILEATHQQYLRQATLKAANDQISNFIASPHFPAYSFDMEVPTAVSTDRNSAQQTQHSRHVFHESTSAKTVASSPTRCCLIMWHFKLSCLVRTNTKAIGFSTSVTIILQILYRP